MAYTAQAFSEDGRTLIRLTVGVEPTAMEFDVRHDERSGQITLIPYDMRTAEQCLQDWDNLAKLASEIPQEEWDSFDAAIKAARTCPRCGE